MVIAGNESAAYHLSGLSLDGGWVVVNRIESSPDHTGGAFSVGYLAQHSSGTFGFLKAFDYSAAFADIDPPRALSELTATYNAERDLLDHCGRRKLKRIVRALAAGTTRISGFSPGAVSYLIFELADGDARDVVTEADPANHLPMIRLAHQATAALAQLHSIEVAHQDVKPSNLLVWKHKDIKDGKLGDLGCAHMEGRPAPHDGKIIAGDCSYAAPEQLYRKDESPRSGSGRRAADMHMLGNLICFLFTGVSYNAILFMCLPREHHWQRGSGSFSDVLPGLVDAHGMALTRLHGALHKDTRDQVRDLIDQLCYPDPTKRGDPVARRWGNDPYRLDRFVTRLDLLYKRCQYRARSKL